MDIAAVINTPTLMLILIGMGFIVESIPVSGAHVVALICTAEVAFNMMHLGASLHDGRSSFWPLAFLGVWALMAFRSGYRSNLNSSQPWHSY